MTDQDILERLKQGNRKFQAEVHAENAEQYQRAASTPQQPHTLIIACADSRVDVESITSSGPGEVFVSRNIGNMVPAYGGMLGGVSAVIEYAIAAAQSEACGGLRPLRLWRHEGFAESAIHRGDADRPPLAGQRPRGAYGGRGTGSSGRPKGASPASHGRKCPHAAGPLKNSSQRGWRHGARRAHDVGVGLRNRQRRNSHRYGRNAGVCTRKRQRTHS